jgi:hypothetical protein
MFVDRKKTDTGFGIMPIGRLSWQKRNKLLEGIGRRA